MNQQTATDTYVDDYCLLKPLIDKLNDFSTSNHYIPEIYYLQKFRSRNVILPGVECSPRVIIEHI